MRPGPFDEDSLDLTQGFVELSGKSVQLRLGRQELSFGSGRLVSVRNGPNVRRAFDGAHLNKDFSKGKLRLFVLSQVEIDRHGFDNHYDQDELMWGGYSTWKTCHSNVDLYYIGLHRGSARYAAGVGTEERHSVGTRVFGRKGCWEWNYEAVYQFGHFAGRSISAWTVASVTAYNLKCLPYQPKLALSANVASGDNADPQHLGTFNPLYPNLSYFEEASILAPQNFYNVEAEISLFPNDCLDISFDVNCFWRLRDSDAVYVRGLRPLPGTAAVPGQAVAIVPSLSVDWQPNRHIAYDLSYSHFSAGEVIKRAGGASVDFVKFEINILF